MDIIKSNFLACDNSFIGELHERGFFSETLFDELINQIIFLLKNSNNPNLDEYKSNVIHLFEIYSFTLKTFLCHHQKDDLYEIKNYKTKFDNIYLYRLEFVIKSFLNFDYLSILNYEDELGKLI